MASSCEKLLFDILEYRRANPSATLPEQQNFALSRLQNEYEGHLTFGDASRIDHAVFGYHGNKCWMVPHGNPSEGDTIFKNDVSLEVFNTGIFTFNVRPT